MTDTPQQDQPQQGSTGGPEVNPATADQEARAGDVVTGQVAPMGEADADREAQAASDQAAQQQNVQEGQATTPQIAEGTQDQSPPSEGQAQ